MKTKKIKPPGSVQRMVRGRRCEDISNDISEGIEVTKNEALAVVKWERANLRHLLNKHNAMRDSLTKIGLTLARPQWAIANIRTIEAVMAEIRRALEAA